MFGIGSTEFLVIILVALLVLGPRNLAKASRTVGRYVGEFRRISTDFQRTLNAEVAEEERQENRDAIRKKVEAAKAAREKRESRKKRKKHKADAAEHAGQERTAASENGQGESVDNATDNAGDDCADNPFVHAEARTPLGDGDGRTDLEDMVCPPKGSPLEAALEKTAREAAEPVKTDDAAPDGQGGRA